jgi:hypothetical protein
MAVAGSPAHRGRLPDAPPNHGRRPSPPAGRFVAREGLAGARLVGALRRALRRAGMPAETARLSRVLWDFAGHYRLCNPPHPAPAPAPPAPPGAAADGTVLAGLTQNEVGRGARALPL